MTSAELEGDRHGELSGAFGHCQSPGVNDMAASSRAVGRRLRGCGGRVPWVKDMWLSGALPSYLFPHRLRSRINKPGPTQEAAGGLVV